MNIEQLHQYLGDLIASGVDATKTVCIHGNVDSDILPFEVNDAVLIEGPFNEDPSPKMCGFSQSSGTFLMLKTNLDYGAMWSNEDMKFREIDSPIHVPTKIQR